MFTDFRAQCSIVFAYLDRYGNMEPRIATVQKEGNLCRFFFGCHVSCSLNSLKGAFVGIIKGDTRSSDYSPCEFSGSPGFLRGERPG